MKVMKVCAAVLWVLAVFNASSQNSTPVQGQLHGNFQVLWQQYNADSIIGAEVPAEKTGMNAFGSFAYTYGNFSAGIRFESYLNAIMGFPGRFRGTGIGSRWAQYKNDLLEITVGNIYEQFGSGMTLRSYWEPNLGIDNALDGIRVIVTPDTGITLKGIYAHQRFDFDSRLINGLGLVRGADAEIFLNDLVPSLRPNKTKITVGGSFVSKFQEGETIDKDTLVLKLPNNVASYAGRIAIISGPVSFSGEYVKKINDPNADNKFIYKEGSGLLLNIGYSVKGFGITLQSKFIDNMAFRSDRDQLLFDVPINYIPSITKQHTYNLASTLYPYATVLNGESGNSLNAFYTVKKETLLGGKYGMNLALNYAAVNNIDTTGLAGNDQVVYGYETNSFAFGKEKFVRDFNVELKKKFSKNVTLLYTYYYMEFNTLVTPVTVDFKGIVFADIHVLEAQVKLNKKMAIRAEAQALFTEQDKKDWGTALFELSVSPHWTFSILDQYNYGNDNAKARVHYLFGTVGYVKGGSRVAIGYGKRREGIFCIGGVCRAVPASNGLELNITSTF
ncbi:MAG: DUF6029 family protein [Flavobacteriales bacterium]|nr:DUF6029 family protein [Flavobacteriales bacterium]